MKKSKLLLAFFLFSCFVSTLSFGWDDGIPTFETGKTLTELAKSYNIKNPTPQQIEGRIFFTGYTTAVYDFMVFGFRTADDSTGKYNLRELKRCIPSDITPSELASATARYITDHPEFSGMDSAVLLWIGITGSFGCETK